MCESEWEIPLFSHYSLYSSNSAHFSTPLRSILDGLSLRLWTCLEPARLYLTRVCKAVNTAPQSAIRIADEILEKYDF